MDFAQMYARMRGSRGFLYTLCVFVFGWFGVSLVTGWDSDHGTLNLVLSFEASISLAFFAVVSETQYQMLKSLMERVEELLRQVKSEEDVILEEVQHDDDCVGRHDTGGGSGCLEGRHDRPGADKDLPCKD